MPSNVIQVVFAVLRAGIPISPIEQAPYLDPGAGSYIIQLLVAGSVALIFLVKSQWARIKAFLGRDKAQEPEDTQDLP